MIEIVLTTGYVIRCKRYERIEHETCPAIRVFKTKRGRKVEEIVPEFIIAEIKE